MFTFHFRFKLREYIGHLPLPCRTRRSGEGRRKATEEKKPCVGWSRISKKRRWLTSSPNYSASPLFPFWSFSLRVSLACVFLCWWVSECVCVCVWALLCWVCRSVCVRACVWVSFAVWRVPLWGKKTWLARRLSLRRLMCECVIFRCSCCGFILWQSAFSLVWPFPDLIKFILEVWFHQ